MTQLTLRWRLEYMLRKGTWQVHLKLNFTKTVKMCAIYKRRPMFSGGRMILSRDHFISDRLNSFVTKVIFSCILALSVGQTMQAQQIKTFRGPYTFYNYEGAAQFEYKQVKRDSIAKHGKFDFSMKYTDSLDHQIFNKLLASGQYRDNQKIGTWRFIESHHRVTVKDVAYFNVKAALESEQSEITANFNEAGQPDGPWSHKQLKYKDEKLIDLLGSSNLQFKNGSVVGSFAFESDQTEGYFGLYSIKGHTTEDGLMDSLWVFKYMRDTLRIDENRYYQEGFLTEIVKIEGSRGVDTLFHKVYHPTKAKLGMLKNGGTSLFKVSERDFGMDFVSGFDERDVRYKTQLHGNNYLKEIFEHLTRFSTRKYYGPDGSEINWPLKTKRFEFATLPVDDTLRIRIQKNYGELSTIVEDVLSSNTFGLNRKRTDSLYYANQYFTMIDSLINRLASMVDKTVSDDYKYFDAFSYARETSFDFMTTDTLQFDYDGKSYSIFEDFNRGLSRESSLLERIDQYVALLLARAREMRNVVNDQMKQIKIGEELQELQSQIITEREELLSEFKKVKHFSKEDKAMFNALKKTFLEDQFEQFTDDYSREELEAGKVDKALEYIETLDELRKLLRPLGSVYRNQSILDSLYMEEVFNPFTYTSYSRRVKEDLFKKSNTLFDFYVQSLKTETDYQKLTWWIGKIEALQKRLEYIRARDTRAIERRLRGRKDISEIEEILGLLNEDKIEEE